METFLRITDLPTPALLIDLDRVERNVERMAAHARDLGVRLRPHVKTHKCVEVGRLQQQAGAAGITVSTLHEAEVFARNGFDDITWAFPISLSRLAEIESLASEISLGVVVDSREAVEAIAGVRAPLRVWMKVDCGYHRCGVDPSSEQPLRLARAIQEGPHQFAGLLSHSGDAYDRPGRSARAAAAERERATIVAVADALRAAGIEVPEASVGSTPGMTAVGSLAGVAEARPGNYVYFDRTQVVLGSCDVGDCAATLLAQVVSTHSTHSVIDAGALALSKDGGVGDPPSMGETFSDLTATSLDPEVRLTSLSQEHGKLSRPLPVGKLIRVLPNHSCLTVACFDSCWAVRGEDVVARWRVFNGR